MEAPLVQLRDHTWSALRALRSPDPAPAVRGLVSDGCGHRRAAPFPAQGAARRGRADDCLLHDHEDNLFLNGWGMANEPVYNQQATAYLLRDELKAVIRAFYSMMACAFSHSVFEPVEHRWAWGQYFGPPSTDGAWFELYRNMLIHERDDGSPAAGPGHAAGLAGGRQAHRSAAGAQLLWAALLRGGQPGGSRGNRGQDQPERPQPPERAPGAVASSNGGAPPPGGGQRPPLGRFRPHERVDSDSSAPRHQLRHSRPIREASRPQQGPGLERYLAEGPGRRGKSQRLDRLRGPVGTRRLGPLRLSAGRIGTPQPDPDPRRQRILAPVLARWTAVALPTDAPAGEH